MGERELCTEGVISEARMLGRGHSGSENKVVAIKGQLQYFMGDVRNVRLLWEQSCDVFERGLHPAVLGDGDGACTHVTQ